VLDEVLLAGKMLAKAGVMGRRRGEGQKEGEERTRCRPEWRIGSLLRA